MKYVADIAPAKPSPFDEGLTITVTLDARSRTHALRRLARYAPGVVTNLRPAPKADFIDMLAAWFQVPKRLLEFRQPITNAEVQNVAAFQERARWNSSIPVFQECTRLLPHICKVNGPCNGLPREKQPMDGALPPPIGLPYRISKTLAPDDVIFCDKGKPSAYVVAGSIEALQRVVEKANEQNAASVPEPTRSFIRAHQQIAKQPAENALEKYKTHASTCPQCVSVEANVEGAKRCKYGARLASESLPGWLSMQPLADALRTIPLNACHHHCPYCRTACNKKPGHAEAGYDGIAELCWCTECPGWWVAGESTLLRDRKPVCSVHRFLRYPCAICPGGGRPVLPENDVETTNTLLGYPVITTDEKIGPKQPICFGSTSDTEIAPCGCRVMKGWRCPVHDAP